LDIYSTDLRLRPFGHGRPPYELPTGIGPTQTPPPLALDPDACVFGRWPKSQPEHTERTRTSFLDGYEAEPAATDETGLATIIIQSQVPIVDLAKLHRHLVNLALEVRLGVPSVPVEDVEGVLKLRLARLARWAPAAR
jgi:hypothetical protein